MMTETPQSNSGPKPLPFGLRLQSAREALGLESKDAAAQLRLNENVILMLEKDCYSNDLPATFLRGYIRSYGKLLQIPENEIKQAIEPIQPKPAQSFSIVRTPKEVRVTSGHYFMQIFTYLIILTLVSLVGAWWYTHSSITAPTNSETSLALPAIDPTPAKVSLPLSAKSEPLAPESKIDTQSAPSISTKPTATSASKSTTVPVADLTDNDAEPNTDNDNSD